MLLISKASMKKIFFFKTKQVKHRIDARGKKSRKRPIGPF